jgi:hypothetical protein
MSTVEKGKRKQDQRSPQSDFEQANPKRKMGDDMEFDVCMRMTTAMDDFKLKVSTTLTAMELDDDPSPKDLRMWIMTLAKTQVGGVTCIPNIMSEVVEEMHCLQTRLREKEEEVVGLKEELAAHGNTVRNVVVTKEKLEAKASSKEMEERLKVATTQFKVMDAVIGKETEDRKELCRLGMEDIRKRVRSDLQKEWEKLSDDVEVAPLTRKSSKQSGSSEYTAPLLFTVQEKTKRWRMEEILRNSKIYPGFHWPQEMISVVKDYKAILKEGGVNEDTTYIRIRPNERDGKVKIRADVKAKEGSGRFTAKAFWEAPPLCPEIRKRSKDHMKPVWASSGRP